MRVFNGQDLLSGSDHEFVVNLYTLVLNRWPDEGGYRHFIDKIEGHPERRRDVVKDVAGSPEARKLGVVVHFLEETAEAPEAPARAITADDFPPEELLKALAGKLGALDAPHLARLETGLLECLGALRAARLGLLEARIAALEARPGAGRA